MRFSVVIPCYNGEAYLSTALESVFGQTLAAHQVIVVDDGSEDASLERLAPWQGRIELLHTRRKGGAGARNAGIRRATGEWVAFLDADDLWHPLHLERAAAAIRARPDLAGIINHYQKQVLPDGKAEDYPWPFAGPVQGHGLRDYIDAYRRYGNFVGMSACLLRRDVLEAIGYLDEAMIRRHDIDCWLRAIRGRYWWFDDTPTSVYRKNREGSLSGHKASANLYRLRAFARHRDELAGYPPFDALLRRLARKALQTSYRAGTAEDRRQAYLLAFPWLGPREKVVYALLRPLPFLHRPLDRAGLT